MEHFWIIAAIVANAVAILHLSFKVERLRRAMAGQQRCDWVPRSRAEVRGLLSAADLEGLERQTASPRGTRP